jgi:hypothetical protein
VIQEKLMQKISKVYNKLYHYTTWDGLLGILNTQALWATHYKFLNDYSEIVLFRDKLISLLTPHVRNQVEIKIELYPHIEQQINQRGGLIQAINHETEVLVDTHYNATSYEIYILSFCGQHNNSYVNNNGLLSQWRGYGPQGGCALVFNTNKLEEMLEIESTRFDYSAHHLSDVIYSNDDAKLKDELSEDLSIIADTVKFFYQESNEQEPSSEFFRSYNSFVKCISCYKHCGFSEENEVRIVVIPVINQEILNRASEEVTILKPEKERKFRGKNDQLVPYIELFNSADIELPIERIIVGPHKEKENRAAALRVKLRKTNIEITCSDIPFIS